MAIDQQIYIFHAIPVKWQDPVDKTGLVETGIDVYDTIRDVKNRPSLGAYLDHFWYNQDMPWTYLDS